MRLPDWVVYAAVAAAVLATVFFRDVSAGREPEASINVAAPAAASGAASAPAAPLSVASSTGPLLPDIDPFDEEVLVQIGEAEDGIGTAFAINKSGVWLTARHVVDGCSEVALAIDDGRVVPVERVAASRHSDLALLFTDRAPVALTLDLDRKLRVGDAGYHVGFPQGASGEVSSALLARSRLVTHGRYALDEPVLAWSETGRSKGVDGTLAGMSGGPVFDAAGEVVGVTVAESAHRGRIYAEAPDAIAELLEAHGLVAPGGEARPLMAQTYSREADRLRRELAVVKVICRVEAH